MMWGGSVCHNPLGPPVNLWTTGTVGQQLVLSIHCVQFVPVMSSVSLSVLLSLWAEISYSSDRCKSASNSYTSSVMSWSVKFSPYSLTAQCPVMQFNTQWTHQIWLSDSSLSRAWPVACYCCKKEWTEVFG